MLNYEVDARLLLPFVPAGTELDCWHGKVFVSLVGFRFLRTRMFGWLAIPMHSVGDNSLSLAYRWRSAKRWNGIEVETEDNPELPAEGSVEQFITEHYWGYAPNGAGGCVEL